MQANRNKVVVLGTGGTIAGTAAAAEDNVGYTAGQVGVAQLVAAVPILRGAPLECEQVAQIDSKDMTLDLMRQLALRCSDWIAREDVQGVVVTHGTDTIEETAWFLQSLLGPAKPIVLTCAMRPATALSPDGPQNLADAVAVVRSPGTRGVSVVCAGVVHDPLRVAKVHPYRLDPFVSVDAGPLAFVEEGRLRQVRAWCEASADSLSAAALQAIARWPRVAIVLSHAGVDGAMVRALAADGVEGIVVAGTGNGTVHQELLAALLEVQAAGVKVVRSTRCAEGAVVSHSGDLLPASSLPPVKARLALILELSSTARPGPVR
jgi:L-asparaginase